MRRGRPQTPSAGSDGRSRPRAAGRRDGHRAPARRLDVADVVDREVGDPVDAGSLDADRGALDPGRRRRVSTTWSPRRRARRSPSGSPSPGRSPSPQRGVVRVYGARPSSLTVTSFAASVLPTASTARWYTVRRPLPPPRFHVVTIAASESNHGPPGLEPYWIDATPVPNAPFWSTAVIAKLCGDACHASPSPGCSPAAACRRSRSRCVLPLHGDVPSAVPVGVDGRDALIPVTVDERHAGREAPELVARHDEDLERAPAGRSSATMSTWPSRSRRRRRRR